MYNIRLNGAKENDAGGVENLDLQSRPHPRGVNKWGSRSIFLSFSRPESQITGRKRKTMDR